MKDINFQIPLIRARITKNIQMNEFTQIVISALQAFLVVPEGAKKIVVFVHGSGSGRFSTRN